MKKKIIPIISISTILLSLGATLLFNPFNKEVKKLEAYAVNPLPTTIDLNDCSEQEIQNYYSDVTGAKGDELLIKLKTVLSKDQKYYSYDVSNGKAIWQMYEITDRDWVKSPASAISGYNASTNVITGYTYGQSASKPGDNPYIHALYINRNATNNVKAWAKTGTTSSHGGNNEWCIDREHIWPKSHGFEDESQGGARGDPMHLWAGDSYVNSALHSNYYYGYVDTSKSYTNGADKWSHISGNYLGSSKTLGGSVKVFEPQDSDKGDIARAVFYMVARYNYLSGSDSDGINSDNPNLALTNSLDDYQTSGYLSTTTRTGKLGILSDLLEWNKLDPVDEYEIHRNNLLFKNFTNNRNPFIDYPDWANIIWGSEQGVADPNSPKGINTGDIEIVNVTGVSIDKTQTSIKVGNEIELKAVITPTNATNKNVSWSSSDTSIATVSNKGVVKALKEGKVTITVTTEDGNKTATCEITIEAAFKLTTPMIIVIAAVAVVIVIIVIIVLVKSKKARKAVTKMAKKQVKKQVKKSTSSSQKKK